MSYFKKSNTSLILLVAILLATNIATIFTVLYNKNENKITLNKSEKNVAPNLSQRQHRFGNYMSDRLKLSSDQEIKFRSLRSEFHTNAKGVSKEIQKKRKFLYLELAKEKADLEKLNQIADEIGLLHANLKKLSINHYVNMKEICSEDQQDELYQMFKLMFKKENRGDIELKKRKYRNKQ